MLGRDETKFDAFVGAHILLNIMTGRPLNLLSKENVDLGNVNFGREKESERK